MNLTHQTLEKRRARTLGDIPGASSAAVRSGQLELHTAIILTFNEEIHIERGVSYSTSTIVSGTVGLSGEDWAG
jgi:hypothetical protein